MNYRCTLIDNLAVTCDEIVDTPKDTLINSNDKKNYSLIDLKILTDLNNIKIDEKSYKIFLITTLDMWHPIVKNVCTFYQQKNG